jgi:multimeric flavodoxin WrbA
VKATILLGTLKKTGLSHTETLSAFFAERLRKEGVECEIVKLVHHTIPPGTFSDMGDGDEWPEILEKVLASRIVVVATPIWWSNPSSLIQRAIERLDEIHDRVMEDGRSPLDGRVGGILITGDSDGAQQVIGNICNFFNAIGILVPPYSTLSVLWERQAKGADPTEEELRSRYEDDYGSTADRMIEQLLRHARSSG